MPYSMQLAQINTNAGGLGASNTAWGFPANTNFHTLLMSYWMCGPYQTAPGATGSPSIWPAFSSAKFFGFGPGSNSTTPGSPFIGLTNRSAAAYSAFFTGNISNPLPTSPLGCLLHFMMSVDTHAQVVQVYINDQPVTITSPTWDNSGTATGLTPPFDFNIANNVNIWAWDVSGVISTGIHPTLGDAWISNTPSFVDLSVTANRRRFIDSQMLPVDLGDTGTLPFGYQPAMYMSIRPGGVATDILTNRGVGGGTWGYSQNPPTFQTDGVCLAIPVPPNGGGGTTPPPVPGALALDDVIAIDETHHEVASAQIFLDWSDDRGHRFGSPVGQPIGQTGEYLTVAQWQRLGYARDRILRVTWSVPVRTALQGAFIEVDTNAKS